MGEQEGKKKGRVEGRYEVEQRIREGGENTGKIGEGGQVRGREEIGRGRGQGNYGLRYGGDG